MSFKDSNMSSSTLNDEGSGDGVIHLELVEKIYQAKRADLLKELRQLQDGTHPKYVEKLKELKLVQENLLMENNVWRDREIEQVEKDYIRATKKAQKEFDDRKNELTETLIADLKEEKEKATEHYNLTTELSLDEKLFDEKPVITRRLRKRPNNLVELVPVPQVKRHKQPAVPNIQYMLHEHEIEHDIKAIQELSLACKSHMPLTSTAATSTIEKNDTVNSSTIKIPGNISPKKCQDSETGGSSTIVDTRIEGGKLLFEKIWYHRGQPVFIEGKQIAKFPAVISAIQNETVWVKKTSDDSKFQINLSHLSKGEMSIKRRAVI